MWYRDVASPGRQAGGELQTEGNLHKRQAGMFGVSGDFVAVPDIQNRGARG